MWAHENGDDNKAIQYLEAVIKSNILPGIKVSS
nr:DUF2659 family protein [Orientia tsutsugamushi]